MPYGMEPLDAQEVIQRKRMPGGLRAVPAPGAGDCAGTPAGPGAGDVPITIRRACPADGPALARLAALDSAAPLAGDLLLAEVEGAPWAALSLHDGRVVSDPFRPAAAARALLQLRADHLAAAAARGGRGRWRILTGPDGLARVLRPH